MTEIKRGFASLMRPLVIAHRGASGEAPENTMLAFALAVQQRADVLELDVHVTRDGVIVVCHDPSVDRTTDGAGLIADMTFEDLKRLDAGYRFTTDGGITFPYRGRGVVIPTLRDVLETYPDVPLNIEIKAQSRWAVVKNCALLHDFGRLTDGSVVLASFDHALMKVIRCDSPVKPATSFSVKETRRFMARMWWKRTKWHSCGFAFQVAVRKKGLRIVTRRFVRHAHAMGYEVHPWTINDERTMRKLLEMGVDGMFTDNPALLRRVIDDREK